MQSSDDAVPFWRCLDEARHREVTETVDRIYAILSLADEDLRDKIPVDYSPKAKAEYWQLFMRVGKAVMGNNTVQAVLAGTNSENKSQELPSWCPDFTSPSEVTTFGLNARAGMQYGRSLSHHWDPKVINIGGARIDTVDHIEQFSWSWPEQDISEIYGRGGLAAQTYKVAEKLLETHTGSLCEEKS